MFDKGMSVEYMNFLFFKFIKEKRLSIGEKMYRFRRNLYPFGEKTYRFGWGACNRY
ncbi:hypothetical protein HanIR_Chr11g0522551 [Helianthus annuus]|nr:hypothetical protein HanIR_Chr11g0522551 [Helianthus annuus]